MLGGPAPFLHELEQPERATRSTNPYLLAYLELTRLAQPWRTRHPPVTGTGNFGSLDADPPADPAFTECALSEFGAAVVDGVAPHLLVNGASGPLDEPAPGFLPHNLREVALAAGALLRDPGLSDEELAALVPGPDFPTGGEVLDPSALERIYREGAGALRIAGTARIDTGGSIVVTELPFGVSKRRLVREASEALARDSLEGAFDLLDESDADSVRLVLPLLAGAPAERALAALRDETCLVTALQVDMSAAVDGAARRVTLPDLLRAYVRRLSGDASREPLDVLQQLSRVHGDGRRTRIASRGAA